MLGDSLSLTVTTLLILVNRRMRSDSNTRDDSRKEDDTEKLQRSPLISRVTTMHGPNGALHRPAGPPGVSMAT